MIHCLFNNVFLETDSKNNVNDPDSSKNEKKLNYTINSENEHILLYALDIYDKAQSIFSVSKSNAQEYVDVVNYIELNLFKSDVMCMNMLLIFYIVTKNKLILLKYKSLFIVFNLEIYDEKNMWSSINSNTNFYKEIENLFSILYNEIVYSQVN